jgi:hypothetical protein
MPEARGRPPRADQVVGSVKSCNGLFIAICILQDLRIASIEKNLRGSFKKADQLEMSNNNDQPQQPQLALPAPGDASHEPSTRSLNVVEGTTIQMDELGPIIGE